MMNSEEKEARIRLYIQNYTQQPSVVCVSCDNSVEYYDQGSGENYCYDCLVSSLNDDLGALIQLTDKYYNKTNTP